jgi:hypothetical protein
MVAQGSLATPAAHCRVFEAGILRHQVRIRKKTMKNAVAMRQRLPEYLNQQIIRDTYIIATAAHKNVTGMEENRIAQADQASINGMITMNTVIFRTLLYIHRELLFVYLRAFIE